MTKQENQQQKYLQLQMLQQQIEQISQNAELMNQQLTEIDDSQEALKQLQETPEGNEILTPIANGIFIKAAIKNTEKLTINVGADVAIEKTAPEVITMLDGHKEELHKNLVEINTVLESLSEQATEIYNSLEEKVE
ncbi:prefoldin subunit alpha [Candidatus Woesearchaeota archaeon]|jgi:prefoldin alpha subunit|nr:prefoldin subunit alpha [Candidatus Woesearchaeota archaeon]